MVKFISPIREKAAAIRSDENYLKKIITDGAEKARESARQTIEQTRDLIGLNYF
jgi:tryptophanyl-tRNA synthetase